MIKNKIFDVYDRMNKEALELMAMALEADFSASSSEGNRAFVKARLAIVYGLLKYKIHNDWLPTSGSINALPEPVRKYIHDIETNVDPARLVRENILIKDTCTALVIKLEERTTVTNKWVKEKAVDTANDYPDIAFPNLIAIFKELLKEAGLKVVKK